MPDIVIDTYKAKAYADRLRAVNARIIRLDGRLDRLYLKVGLLDLWNLMQADVLAGYSWRLVRCQNYLNQTATEFEKLEKNLDYNKVSTNRFLSITPINIISTILGPRHMGDDYLFYIPQINEVLNEYLDLIHSDGDIEEKSRGVIKWLSSIKGDISKYKDYIGWLTENKIELPDFIEDGLDFIKALDTGSKLVFGLVDYGQGIENNNLESMTDGADGIFSALKSGIEYTIETNNEMIDFQSGLILDYGKNMVSNWLESIQKETKVSEVYWNTFANSAVEVFNDTVCNTPTLAIAYQPAKQLSSMVGFDLQGAYENVSDKEGFAAVTDSFSKMNDIFMENSRWENWKSGMSVIGDGIAEWFN